jgi:putative flippase GtrA
MRGRISLHSFASVWGSLLLLLRSAAAGALATLVDLLTLSALVQFAGLTPRVASVPALLLGGVAMFLGQKFLAFRAKGEVGRELALFTLVELGGLALTAALFELCLRALPTLNSAYVLVRLVVTNVVWLSYSFPLWNVVFKTRAVAQSLDGSAEG